MKLSRRTSWRGAAAAAAAALLLSSCGSTAPVAGQPIRDEALLTWVREVVDAVVDRPAVPAAG